MEDKLNKIAKEILLGKLKSIEVAEELKNFRNDQNHWLKEYFNQIDSFDDRLRLIEILLGIETIDTGADL